MTLSVGGKHQPSEEEVVEVSRVLLSESPTLGIAKVLTYLQKEKQWALSEKRLKSILIAAGLRPCPATQSKPKSSSVPISSLDVNLPFPDGVRAVYFDSVKGRGLVAARDFSEGETIFTEDAFVAAPPGHAYQAVEIGELCTHCFAPLSGLLVVSCGKSGCQSRFCNRLCQSRAQSLHHALLCPGQNPSIKPFNSYLSVQKWLSLSIVARSIACILLTHSPFATSSLSPSQGAGPSQASKHSQDGKPPATIHEMMSHFDAFATVSELERRARNPGWEVEQGAFLGAMKEGYRLLCDGMDPRKARKGRWPLYDRFPPDVAAGLFSWETFLRMLGRSNLNTEAQGGLYLVHSHFNHSCAPNVHVTHPPSRAGVRQATKVMLIARRDIKKGEELFITYQNPDLTLARRRLLLWREYMFGPCECERCKEEEGRLSSQELQEMERGSWKKDEREQEEVEMRRKHAEMLDKLENDRSGKLKADGKVEDRDLLGMEEELRSSLGF